MYYTKNILLGHINKFFKFRDNSLYNDRLTKKKIFAEFRIETKIISAENGLMIRQIYQ